MDMTTDCDISAIYQNNTRYYNFFPICQRTSSSPKLKAQSLKLPLEVDDVKMMNLQTNRLSIVKHQYVKN